MLAICDKHDQFSARMRNRLMTTSMGLGLVRLLIDAGLTEEAKTTLSLLDNGSQGVAEVSDSINVLVTVGPSIHRCPRRN